MSNDKEEGSSNAESQDEGFHLAALKEVLFSSRPGFLVFHKDPGMACATQLLDFLYLGDSQSATDLDFIHTKNITHVINCAAKYCQTGAEFYGADVKYLGFEAEDDDDYDMMQHFDEAYTFIEDARKSNGAVLVHCMAGINRSGLIAAAYMMLHQQTDPITVATTMRQKRGLVIQNESFQKQLLQFAKERNLLPEKKCMPTTRDHKERIDQLRKVLRPYVFQLPPKASCLLDFLYLGGKRDATNLTYIHSNSFTHIINCAGTEVCTGADYYGKTIQYLEFPAADVDEYDMMQHFNSAYEFIKQAREAGGKVLIHCVRGINRSGLLATAYVALHQKIDIVKAARYVKDLRGCVLTNDGFQIQLVQFAEKNNLLPKE